MELVCVAGSETQLLLELALQPLLGLPEVLWQRKRPPDQLPNSCSGESLG